MANIWLAAGEGKLEDVQRYIEQEGVSPNALDDNAYSPLHAAASWNHPEILNYLVEKGGDINITDDDGETPLFVVENVGMARLVVELGGNPNHRNQEGMTAAQQLEEDYPHISVYLRTISGEASATRATLTGTEGESSGGEPDLDAPTDELMSAVRTIMEASQRGELTEAETDEKLREVVEQIVGDQMAAGQAIGAIPEQENESNGSRKREEDEEQREPTEVKQPRENIGR